MSISKTKSKSIFKSISKSVWDTTTYISFVSLIMIIFFINASCGKEEDDDNLNDPTYYATFALANSQYSTDNASVQLTSVTKCTRNKESGLVKVQIGAGSGKPSLNIKIKNASSEATTYTCSQDASNEGTKTGFEYENCFIEVDVLSDTSGQYLNTYSMARVTTSISPDEPNTENDFKYEGECSITISTVTPTLKGEASCTQMVQTKLKDRPRNPVLDDVTADLSISAFYCTLTDE